MAVPKLNKNNGGERLNRSSSFLEAETSGSAPKPVAPSVQPDFPTNVPLQFTILSENMSKGEIIRGRFYPTEKDLRKLNLYSHIIQDSARWYLKNLAGSIITYLFIKNGKMHGLRVQYEKKHWSHLTGLYPVYRQNIESPSERFIKECATGNTSFINILLNQGHTDKIQLLPALPEIIQADAFVFTDISPIQKFNALQANFGVYSDDKNLMLLLRDTIRQGILPVSLIKASSNLKEELATADKTAILGVVREYNGHVETLSVNTRYITDNGAHMARIVRNHDYTIVHTRKPHEQAHHSPQKPTGFVR